MRKSLLFLTTLSAFIATSMSARTLSPTQALARALSEDAPAGKSHHAPISKTPLLTIGQPDVPAIYVFDQGTQGYLVVSADDVAAPVLGYSSTGTFDPDNIPENMRWWLSQYEAEISAAISNGSVAYAASPRASRSPIAPILTTTWDQGMPYSNFCPLLNGERTVTGCVATAMAQVMYSHKWPETFNANFSYTWNNGKKTLSWTESDVKLDWDNMLNSYKGEYTTVQANAVALLMKACGYSVDMSYNIATTGGSGAMSYSVLNALINTFGYDKGAYVAMREYYSLTDWEDLIYNNLANCGAVIYAGANMSAGHCFVCDGYSTDGYFHFNWGWSGTSDGYYRLTALDPGSQGIGGSTAGYNLSQLVTLGIRKPVAGSTMKLNILCQGTLWATSESANKLTVTGGFYNFTPENEKGQFGVRFTDENNNTIKETLTALNNYSYLYGVSAMAVSDIPEGTSRLYPIFKSSYGETIVIPCPADQAGYLTINKTGTKITVTAPEVGRYTARDLTFETPFYKDMQFWVKGKASWTGSFSSSAPIYGVLMTGTTAETVVAYAEPLQQEFPADNEAVDFEYQAKWVEYDTDRYPNGLTTGRYYFAMAMEGTDYGWNLISTPTEIQLKNNPGDPEITLQTFEIVNRTNVDPDNITVNLKVKCKAGYFFTDLIVAFFNANNVNVGQFNSPTLYIPAGETASVSVTCQLPNAVAGETYYVAPYTSSGKQLTMAMSCTIGDRSAITAITADRKALTATPNPAVDHTVITAPAEISKVDLVAISGSSISVPAEIDGNIARLDVSSLTPGLYLCRVITTEGAETVKIIKK